MNLCKTTKIAATAVEVWRVVAHPFNDANNWMAAAPRSYGNDNIEPLEGTTSAWRICQLQPDGKGMQASVRFATHNEATKTCTIRDDLIDAPPRFPVDFNSLDHSVINDPGDGSTATWTFGAKIMP